MGKLHFRTSAGPGENAMSRKKILLPNDLELFLELKRTFLRRDDLDLLSTGSGKEAYAMVDHYRPELVFLDLRMEEMNGDECCRRIKNNPDLSSIPVTMIVEKRLVEDLKRCQKAGADHILSKPLNPHLLAATVRRYQGVIERAAPRVEARLRVHFGQSHELLTSYSVNLSTGGLFLETGTPLPAETPLNLEFFLPDSAAIIRCKGRVAWVNPTDRSRKPQLPSGMGIQFLDLTMKDMDEVRDFVKRECIAPSW